MSGEVDKSTEGYELRLERSLNAPCANVWRCWTEPELLRQWFTPPSWTTEIRALEPHPGGTSHIIMRGPNGDESEGVAAFLEAVPERRLVFTNVFGPGWIPASHPAVVPFMVTIIEMSPVDPAPRTGTSYTVRALHWTEAARNRHRELGFHDGWAGTISQLETLARTL